MLTQIDILGGKITKIFGVEQKNGYSFCGNYFFLTLNLL